MLKGLFGGPKTFLAPEVEAWHLEAWAWLLGQPEAMENFLRAELVEPTTRFFPSTGSEGEERIREIVEGLASLGALDERWEFVIQLEGEGEGYEVPDIARNGGASPRRWTPSDGPALITYEADQLSDPLALAASIAHQVAFFRLTVLDQNPPGGADAMGHATDLAMALCGFGLLGAMVSLRHVEARGIKASPEVTTQGYLSPPEWAFALAIFQKLREQPIEPLKRWLSDASFDDLRRATRYLSSNPTLLLPVLQREADARALPIAEA